MRAQRRLSLLLATLLGLAASGARAQVEHRLPAPPSPTSASDDALSLLSPKPHSAHNPLLRPNKDYRGLHLGDWMLYPSLLVGGIYDSNLVWSSHFPVRAAGVRVNPRLVADRDAGIHKTTVYAEADARIFPSLTFGEAVTAQLGASHVWEVQRDLVVRARLQFDRRALHLSGGLVTLPGGGSATLASPLLSNGFTASAAIQKSFDRLFVGASVESEKRLYESFRTSGGLFPQNYRDSFVNTFGGRAGAWISPAVYAFGEALGNIRDVADSTHSSHGYRVLAGLGSDRVSLFRGELFAGVQRQYYENAALSAAASPVFGGKIFWYPTRAITVRATLDQTFSDANLPSPSNPNGHPARVTAALLHLHYQIAKHWSATVRGGYLHSVYLGGIRRDDAWQTGATFSYDIYRNMALTLDYDFQRVNSNSIDASFTRNAVNIGLKYRY